MRRIDERRPLPTFEGKAPAAEAEWLGPSFAPWSVVRFDGRDPPLTGGFPVTAEGGVHFTLFPLLERTDVPELWGFFGGGAALTARPLGPVAGFRVVREVPTDKGLLTLLAPAETGTMPSVVDVQEAHAAARAAGGGIVHAAPFPFERRQEPVEAEGPDLGEYAVAAVGGLLLGMVVAKYW